MQRQRIELWNDDDFDENPDPETVRPEVLSKIAKQHQSAPKFTERQEKRDNLPWPRP